MTITIGYWKIRGLRQPIIYCLEYTGLDYKEDFFEIVPDSDGKYNFDSSYKDSKWGSEIKPNSTLDFPNLPYLFDGETKITQMLAIMSYVCRKAKMLIPTSDKSQTQMEMMNGVIGDFRSGLVRICYGASDDNALVEYSNSEKFLDFCQKFDNYFSKNKFCAGDELTWADLNLFELLDTHKELIDVGIFKNFDNLTAFVEKIGNLEKIKIYRESDRFFKRPINNWSARFY